MSDDKYWEMITRQVPLVSKEEQEKFKNAKITVIGCGGIGGEAIEMLARMGVGELVLVDEDVALNGIRPRSVIDQRVLKQFHMLVG